MAHLTDIPFHLFSFLLLIKLSITSKQSHARCREALKLKNRGEELIAHFANMPTETREMKIRYQVSSMDTWHMWMYLGFKVFGPSQNTLIFLSGDPMTVDVCTTHRNDAYNIDVSSQHSIDMVAPRTLFPNVLQSSMCQFLRSWTMVIDSLLLTDTSNYIDLWWRTSDITVYEVDLVHHVCYQYTNVVISSINGDRHMSIPPHRKRVSAYALCDSLTEIIGYCT